MRCEPGGATDRRGGPIVPKQGGDEGRGGPPSGAGREGHQARAPGQRRLAAEVAIHSPMLRLFFFWKQAPAILTNLCVNTIFVCQHHFCHSRNKCCRTVWLMLQKELCRPLLRPFENYDQKSVPAIGNLVLAICVSPNSPVPSPWGLMSKNHSPAPSPGGLTAKILHQCRLQRAQKEQASSARSGPTGPRGPQPPPHIGHPQGGFLGPSAPLPSGYGTPPRYPSLVWNPEPGPECGIRPGFRSETPAGIIQGYTESPG